MYVSSNQAAIYTPASLRKLFCMEGRRKYFWYRIYVCLILYDIMAKWYGYWVCAYDDIQKQLHYIFAL